MAGLSKGRRVTLRKGRHLKIRKLALVMAVAAACGRANALGLGEIELYSALNEPLNAEVRLLSVQAGELSNAVVHLAPNEEFARAGIERSAIMSDINFTVAPRNDGTAVVKITSTQAIREPFLDFILQLNWQSGSLLREYTLLLDPPVFGAEKSAPVAAPITESPAVAAAQSEAVSPPPVPTTTPAPATATTPSVIPTQASAATPRQSRQPAMAPTVAASASSKVGKTGAEGEMSYGPTRRNETLWNIASTLRPDDSVSVYQMMMALLKSNPQAFYNNNVNNLKAGYVLRVPGKSTVMSVDQSQAFREAVRQYESWQQAKRGSVPTSGGEAPAPVPAPEQATEQSKQNAAEIQDKDTARLRLVAPGDISAKPSAAGGVQAEIDKLRSDLAIALESSDTAKREGDDLRSRVAALEQQINSLQRLLTLKDQALSDMQKRSGLEVPKEAQAPAPSMEVPPAVPSKTVTAKPATPSEPEPKKTERPPELLSNPTLVGAIAGAALLLLSVLWLILRRRRGSDESESFEANDSETTPPAIKIQSAQDERVDAPAAEEVMGNAQQMTQVAEEVAQSAAQDIPQAASNLDVLHTSEGDIDPIVEADVYLAYRRYQQAESLVQSALAKQPGRQDLQAKLLEIYYAAKNTGAFQAVAKTLYENLGGNSDDPLWQRILPMGRELCPDHDLFKSSTDTYERQQHAVSKEALSDDSSGAARAEDTRGFQHDSMAASGGSPVAEDVFDLNLGMAGSAASSGAGGGATAVAPQDEKMEFDLNLGEITSEESAAFAVKGRPERSSEALSENLGFAGLAAAATGNVASARAHEDDMAGDKARLNSWEIDPAMSEFGNIDFGLDDSDLLAGTDVVGTKLDLARAYLDMGDNDSARDILKEVIAEGNEQQRQEAKGLVEKIAS